MTREDRIFSSSCARYLIAALCCLIPAGQALGVIVGTTDTSDFSDPGSNWFGMNSDYVYQTGGGTSVAVSGFHLLTAKHYSITVGATFTINGDQFEVTARQSPPPDSGETLGADLRILTLKNNTRPGTPMPGFYQLYTGSFSSGQDMIIVGTGKTGADHTTYYTEDENSSRVKRWGTNEYVSSARVVVGASFSTRCLRMNFNSGDTEYEAGYGNGDSGGGVFVKEGGLWKLAGIHLYRETSGIDGQYTHSWAAEIPAYADWINETVPEPASAFLLACGALFLRPRRRKGQPVTR